MKFYSETDVGKVRKINQDAVFGEVISENLAWAVVCDGMGGTSGGEIASNLAVEKIKDVLKDLKTRSLKNLMQKAVKEANLAIIEKATHEKNLEKMGTTVVLCVVKNSVMHSVHAGDSRTYIISKKDVRQIGEDHSIVQEMLKNGDITEKEAKNHPQKNIITKALGTKVDLEPEYNKENLKKGEIALLCTDGVTTYLDVDEILKIYNSTKVKDLAKKLIEAANNYGGTDNSTIAILEI